MQAPRYLLQCPNCDFIQEQHFSYCGQCRQALLQHCTQCQQFSPLHFQGCGYCGAENPAFVQQIAAHPAPSNSISQPVSTPSEHKAVVQTAIARMSERRKAAVIFCDICGFTAMSEQLDPEEVSNIVEPLFRRCNLAINRYGGFVEKFIGDALMAVFGTPIAHEDDAERAALAALEMQRIIQAFSTETEAQTGIRLNMRIGLNLGDIVVGSVEAATGRQYQILGDAINVAARMEQNAEPGQILVTEELFRQLQDNFELSYYRDIQAKGKALPLSSYQLLGLRHLRPRRRDKGEQTLFVGRAPELQQLQSWGSNALLELKTGWLLLSGSSGIGKTRMAEELYQALQQQEPALRWLQTHSTSYSQQMNYLLLQSLVRQLLELENQQDLFSIQSKIQQFFKQHALSPSELEAEILLSLLCPQHELPDLQFFPPEHLKQQIFKTVQWLLQHFADQQALFICLDDLQWADSLSLEWLGYLQTQAEPLPALLCMIARSSEINLYTDFKLHLGPLAKPDCQQFLLHKLEESTAPDQLTDMLEALLQRAEGNVYYLEEGLRHLLDAGQLSKQAGEWTLVAGWQMFSLPDSLQSLVLSRVDLLRDELREILQILSVAGNNAPISLLEAFFQQLPKLPPETLLYTQQFDLQNLEELRALGFISSQQSASGSGLSFQQALTQEVVYNTLTNRRKQVLHQHIGLALEGLYRSDLSPVIELLAYHFGRSQDAGKAVFYLCQAAQQAARFFANQQAIANYQQALEWLDKVHPEQLLPLDLAHQHWLRAPQLRIRILQWQAEILLLQGAHALVLEQADSQLSCQLEPEDRARMLYCKGRALEKRNAYQAAFDLYQEARELLQNQPDRQILARIWNAIGWSAHWLQDYAQAGHACQQALSLLKTHPDMEQISYAHNVLGVVAFQQHRWEDALEHYQQVLGIQHQIQNLWGQANVLSNLGMTLVKLQHWPKGLRAFAESLRLRKQLGDREGIAISLNNLGHVYREMGDFEQAEAVLEDALEHYQVLNNPLGMAISQCNLGTVKKRQGQLETALELLVSGINSVETLNLKQLLPELYLERIEACLALGMPAKAAEYLQENAESVDEYGDPSEQRKRKQLWEALQTDDPELSLLTDPNLSP